MMRPCIVRFGLGRRRGALLCLVLAAALPDVALAQQKLPDIGVKPAPPESACRGKSCPPVDLTGGRFDGRWSFRVATSDLSCGLEILQEIITGRRPSGVVERAFFVEAGRVTRVDSPRVTGASGTVDANGAVAMTIRFGNEVSWKLEGWLTDTDGRGGVAVTGSDDPCSHAGWRASRVAG